MKNRFFIPLLQLGLGIATANAQSNTTASGKNILGTGGSVSYSVGQMVYANIIGIKESVVTGVQQPLEIQVVLGNQEFDIKLEGKIYPNPTTDVLNIVIENTEIIGLTYQLYDLFGRLLLEGKIQNEKTEVEMSGFSRASYLLNVNQNNKIMKTFKIIKN
ncbi:putative secreted protein (Por secretion system target) [Flavobacterium sp. 1]|uniref:T9SS type A sorting domain-containing protein n=1 Tax=Flavobacterium sp. 1 TaxID=2035200 RepID=UPI000C233AC3|nr:T9SS type A sorting domain-containing protein [Flavobacterium sp. 1]PJJ08620.1 putative secreted protein (Por secretion system target) [Flavobacterium sp. 1]